MVGTTDACLECPTLLCGRRGFYELRATMAADVIETVQRTGLIADQQDALAENIDQPVVAFGLEALEAAGTKPFPVKYRLTLAREMPRVQVMLPR